MRGIFSFIISPPFFSAPVPASPIGVDVHKALASSKGMRLTLGGAFDPSLILRLRMSKSPTASFSLHEKGADSPSPCPKELIIF